MNKLNTFALKMELNAKDKLNKFFRNTEGSETTEKIGMVVVAVVIIAAVAAVLKVAMHGLFQSIMDTAKSKLNDIFTAP